MEGFDRGPTPMGFAFRLALQTSATLNIFELWDGEEGVMSAGLPPGPGGPRDGPLDGSPQPINLGLLPGQVGEIKIGATVAAHLTFKETTSTDGKREVRLIGAGVAFALIDPSIPQIPSIDPEQRSAGASDHNADVGKSTTLTVKQ